MIRKDFLRNLQFANEVCNLLRNKQKSRYESQNVHVTDIVMCSVKLYLSRIQDTAEDCGAISTMRSGILWEEDIKNYFTEKGFYHKVPLLGSIITTREKLNVLAHPDFISDITLPDMIIELITTNYKESSMIHIVKAQTAFLQQIGVSEFDFEHNEYSIFHNSMIKMSAFYKALSYINPNIDNIQFLYLFIKDDFKSFKFRLQIPEDQFDIKTLEHYYKIFLDWINATLYALRESNKGLDDKTFIKLLKNEISSSRILNYYQCNECPYRQNNKCPSIPPLKKWTKTNLKQMIAFKEFWKLRGVNLPKLPEIKKMDTIIKKQRRFIVDPKRKGSCVRGEKTGACIDKKTGRVVKCLSCKKRDTIDITQDVLLQTAKTDWHETIAWVKEVREILRGMPLPVLFLNLNWLGFLPPNIKV